MLDVSAFVLTQNNERTIKNCLDSVTWCDEIVVIDSFSTDSTPAIIANYPKVRLLQHQYTNAMEQRIWGVPHVQSKWTFILDSDEVCTEALRDKLIEILKSGDDTYDGYLCLIRTSIMGKLLKHKDLLSSKGKRLVLTKHATRYWEKSRVHASIRLDNKVTLPKKYYIIHDPIRSFDDHFKKMIRYAKWQAEDMFDDHKQARWWHFTLRPMGKFLQFYVLNRGFRDGINGLILCTIGAINVALKYMLLAELNHEAKRK